MSKPKFATPLPQSSRSEVLEWRFPRPWHQYVLTGKSRAAWHTSFVVPQLSLLLDAGLCINSLRPKHIFLTHGHSDHTLLVPAFATGGDDPPDVFCPAEMRDALDDFIDAKTLLNLGGHITLADLRQGSSSSSSEAEAAAAAVAAHSNDDNEDGNDVENDEPTNPNPGSSRNNRTSLRTHVTHGLLPGAVVPLSRVAGPPTVSATAFACDHTVPCLGYLFSATTQKLRPEYASLPGPALRELRLRGEAITAPRSVPVFAFLGDTTAATLVGLGERWQRQDNDGGDDVFASPPAVVITECSFLYEEHRAQAVKTRHTLWSDLEPVVRRWPAVTFVVTHFSLRYSDADVRRFFAQLPEPPGNIVVWVDGEN